MDSSTDHQTTIMIVEGDQGTARLLTRTLEQHNYRCLNVPDPSAVVAQLVGAHPSLLMLDLELAADASLQLLRSLGPWTGHPVAPLAILGLTSEISAGTTERLAPLGVGDYLRKPVDAAEIAPRVRALLRASRLQADLHAADAERDDAQIEVLNRLALASEFRDDEPVGHPERVGRTAALMARELGLADVLIEQIRRAAPLHDIGKLAIPDGILLKPGKLSNSEHEVMRSHVTLGAEIFAHADSPLLQACERIARSHHERWDGTGYATGIEGEAIPIEARLVAVADAFDALTHRRPYRDAWPVPAAVAEIAARSGEHFDPQVVGAFMTLEHERLLSQVAT